MTLSPNLSPDDAAAIHRALLAPTADVTGNGSAPERPFAVTYHAGPIDMVEDDMADVLDALADGGEPVGVA